MPSCARALVYLVIKLLLVGCLLREWCQTSSDHVVIYGINLDNDHELKMLSRPHPTESFIKIPTTHEDITS